MQGQRNTNAAKRLVRKLLKGLKSALRVIVTGKLRSHAATYR